jgi:hypothetical protein
MSETVDGEVKRILDEAYHRATEIITNSRELLDRIAMALLERETLDREDLGLLCRGEPLPPRSLPPAPPTPTPAAAKGSTSAPVRPPMLGTPPAEPAGA